MHAWCLIRSSCCCCMNPIIHVTYIYCRSACPSFPSNYSTHSTDECRRVLLCASLPPAHKWSQHAWRWWWTRCINVQLKAVPTRHALNTYIIYVTTVCSGYIHAPRELMLWTQGGRGGESVTYMIGQRSSYCRSWFELYQPILIQLKFAVNNMAQLCSLEKPLLMYFLHLQNSETCRDLLHCNYLSW